MCIKMFAPGFVAVNRNEYETREFHGKSDRISRCRISHKRYSCANNRFWHFLNNSSGGDPRPPRPQRQRQDHPAQTDQRNVTALPGRNPGPGPLHHRLGPHPPSPRHRLRHSGRRPFPPFHCFGKCRARSHSGKMGCDSHRRACRGNAQACGSRSARILNAPPAGTLRRAASTRRRRPRSCRRSLDPADG